MAEQPDIKPIITQTPTGVKIEDPSRQSILRLASFRMPRDLTLGGSSSPRRGGLALNAQTRGKRTFTPNLNVQRNKPKEETKTKEEPTRKERNAGKGQSSRGRSERGRGKNIIQQTGVFSEGMGSDEYKAGRSRFSDGGGGGGGSSGGETVMKPKVDFKATLKADLKEEEARLKLLLRDDFIDDPDAVGPKVLPIQLPVSARTRVKTEVKKEIVSEDDNRNGMTVPGVKIKQEPVDRGLFGNDVSYAVKTPLEDENEGLLDFLCKREPEFILLQLPDCLPGLRPSSEPETSKGGSSSSAGTSQEKKLPQPQQQCTLSTLSDSQLGKIELLRSGAARLRIGELTFPLSLGVQAGFRQDVVAVELDDATKGGSMINVGCIQNRLIAVPDWDLLLFQSSGGRHDTSVDSLLYQMSKT